MKEWRNRHHVPLTSKSSFSTKWSVMSVIWFVLAKRYSVFCEDRKRWSFLILMSYALWFGQCVHICQVWCFQKSIINLVDFRQDLLIKSQYYLYYCPSFRFAFPTDYLCSLSSKFSLSSFTRNVRVSNQLTTFDNICISFSTKINSSDSPLHFSLTIVH